MSDWQPDLYNRFRRYRAEPVEHILSRLDLAPDDRVADLGCGPGENTVELARRVPRGFVHGIDLSPAMIDAAARMRAGLAPDLAARLTFAVGDIADLDPAVHYSVIFSNAALQWLRDHRHVLARWLAALTPAGRMVVQMPANETETAKVELARIARDPRWATRLARIDHPFREIASPTFYSRMMQEIGFVEIDCYYMTFHHPMESPGEVVEWYRSTGLRPYLGVLAQDDQEVFLREYRNRLETAYGTRGPMTFDFKRLFLWARRPAL